MSMKKFFRKIASPILDERSTRQERTFYLLAFVALTAFAFAILVTAIMHFSPMQIAARVAIWLVFFLLVLASLKLRRTKLVIHTAATFLAFGLFPFNFFSGGGIEGGSAVWNLFALICVLYLIESKAKFVLLAGNIIILAACCAIEKLRPDLLISFDGDTLLNKSIIAIFLVSIMVFLLVLFQNRLFRLENEKSLKQKKEIEDLSLAQNRFFSSMSHEIRTPINTIVGLNEMILREDGTSEETAENALAMQSAGRMLLSLVNDILDLSKIDAGKMEIVVAPYDTGTMLSELVNMMWHPAKSKGLELHINVDGKIPARLVGDETRVKQVLINILNNAVKYTQKGCVTLSVQCEKSGTSASAVNMIYTIADTGIGIKQENIPHLFTVFKRVDLEKTHHIEGTGLGLSIVKQLLNLMGGTVDVNSIYTQGSTFIVKIPQAVEGDEVIDESAIRRKHRIWGERKATLRFTAPAAHVLIVDDNEANLMVAEKLLRETEAKVDTATSAAECLKKTRGSRYDVIFMDHLMPEMDGIECLHEVRRQRDGLNAETPVVALTANAGSDNQMLYRREGFDSCILKPVSGRQLEDELLRHLPHELVRVIDEDEVNEVFESPVRSGGHKASLMIAADCSADIPAELAEKNDIIFFYAEIETDGGIFLDGIEIDQDGLMRYMAGGGKKFAAIDQTAQSCLAVFPQWLSQAQRVIYLKTSSKVTASSYFAACEAARSFSSIAIFDSWHLSSGLGLMTLKAAELARQGMETEKILEELVRLRKIIQTSFVVNDTKYLLDAGRISKTACKICDALLLHPVVVLKNGHMIVGSIKVGAETVFWKKYIKWVLRKPWTIDKSAAFVTYAGMEQHRLREIEREIQDIVGFERVYFQKASASISANCGPGTFGVIFMRKS